MATTKQYKYFLYSQSQHGMCDEIEQKAGREYVPGQVMSNGRWREFTEISSTATNNRYADAKVVAEGYLDDIQFKQPSRKQRRTI